MEPDRSRAVSRFPGAGTLRTTTAVEEVGPDQTSGRGQVPARPSTSRDEESNPSISRESSREHLVLRLVPQRNKKNKDKKKKKMSVQWAEDVVDNEFLNKKKSKKCCIFHRQRAFGEWSDDSDSDVECESCSHETTSQN